MNQKVLSRLLAAVTLSTALVYPQAASAAAPAPVLHDDNPSGHFGDWYTGAVPPNASKDKPVILFVQGLHSSYNTWYTTDGYYDAAYNAGYRTAFVQLKDADGTGGNMWTNGAKLAEVIKKVADYYGVSKINIIAHSKGGIDTQAALVHYGAHPYVNVVHQLSTPNKGSELADMAYSNWAGWLADILGKKDDAVYSLQTSYMANFRAQTDSRSEVSSTKTYMAAGTGDDGWFSATWFGHAVLPGQDDGAVSVESAFGLPYGIKSFTKDVSHGQIAKASQTWNLVQPKLQNASMKERAKKISKDKSKETTVEESSVILRGGEVEDNTSETFFLESGVDKLNLDTMTSSEDTIVTLISPSGKKYEADLSKTSESEDEPGIFQDAVHHFIEVEEPEAGEWTLEVEGSDEAFFMVGSVDGGEEAKVKASKKVFKKGDKAKISVDLGKNEIDQSSLEKANLTRSMNGEKASVLDEVKFSVKEDELTGNFTVPTKPGVYNLSFDITGINEDGEPFTRSINYNFAVTNSDGELEK
ncbi:alpha/beta hydrolase [Brevibacillus brevis]|uniref:alpha/beta hydrolase n=1 Tax=Brevibacillus brevis TaxID=1393 RepID=UPI0025A50FCD|nr:alpha/beta hydrolase [Brevibacillus brevis]WJQ84358.1 alpha/beta hydrolase [Brevibacillus brevis]